MIWPGVFALVFTALSHSKGSAADRAWRRGDTFAATRLAATADTLRTIALVCLIGPVIALILFVVLMVAITTLGTTGATEFSSLGT